jgi:copper transport protein
VGLVGVLLSLLSLVVGVVRTAAEKQLSLGAAAAAGGGALAWRVGCLVAALVGFLVARAGSRSARAGWALAGAATLGLALRNVVTGDWKRLVNPLHILAGGLWIGTLFVLVAALLSPAARRAWTGAEGHAAATARMVRRFSRLALVSTALLATTGVITAWRHLKYVAALWTTPYGWALDAKLLVVVVVATIGAYNWRVSSPRLGAADDAATDALTRSSRTELALALVVLLITSVLVSLPAPRPPA